ncbi:MAG: ABC transporter substrate-binding protein [Actinomycetota bacterium]
MKQRRFSTLIALFLALGLIASACGGSDDADDTASDSASEEEASASASEEESSSASEEEDAMDDEEDAMDDEEEADDDVTVLNEEVDEAGTEAEGDVDTEVEATDVERQRGGDIAVGLEAEIVGMRPWEDTCGSNCYNIQGSVFDKLMESTADGTYEGWLLESIGPNEDFTAWTGVLREGVSFTNGVPLNAAAIEAMWPIQQEGSQSAGQITASNLANVEATGEYEVTWSLSSPNSAFPAYLSRAQLGFVFEAGAAADQEAFNENPVGTGPFIMVSRDLDNETVLERNPDYWLEDKNGTQLPYLDSISFRPIPDEGTRLDAVLSGTTNVAHTLRQGTIRDGRAARDGGEDIILYEFQGNNVGGGMFNNLVPPYDDVRVRRGLTHLNPQDQVIEALGGTGISLPGTQWFSPDSVWYSEKAASAFPQFDFEAGVALLTEYVNDPERSDGKAVGETIFAELSCPPDPTLIAAMQVIEQVWSSTGLVELELTNYDQQTHIGYALGSDNGFVGNHTTHCWRVATDEDPSTFLNAALSPPTADVAAANGLDGIVSPLNWSNYFNPEVFGALVAAIQTNDFEERYALYEQVMITLAEDVPIWFSGHTATAFITDSNIQGLNSWELPNGTLGAGLPNVEGRWGQVWLE